MSGTSAELNPLFARFNSTASSTRRRPTAFQRESTRLRSNVADQVQRDLLPAGRLLSVFLVLCELLAEVAVLFATWGQRCDRPLRFWVLVLITLQTATVLLHCLNMWDGLDAFSPHRAGLSASDPDMYDSGVLGRLLSHRGVSGNSASGDAADTRATSAVRIEVGVDTNAMLQTITPAPRSSPPPPPPPAYGYTEFLPGSRSDDETSRPPEFVDYYVRMVNAIYLVWYIVGSMWVSGGGTCASTAPHLYRLVVALTIIYYALLFLPLACFCLIVCCLPLFILVYRIMLPYAERERRRARAADPSLVQSLSCVPYSPASFAALSGTENVEDASCVICLCDYEPGEQVRFLPCKHHFHQECVDVWLQLDKACCLCKQDIDSQGSNTASAV